MGALPTAEARPRVRKDWAWRLAVALLLGASMILTTTRVWSLELEAVLNSVAVSPPSRVDFREERHNPMLQDPMMLTGYLEYLGAGVLHKVIQTPFEEALLVNHDQVTIERDGEVRRLALGRSRSLKTILGAIEAILSGDSNKLESIFDYELSGTSDEWSVRLTPISRRIAKHLSSLQIKGGDQALSSIRVDLEPGEWHVIHILRGDNKQ